MKKHLHVLCSLLCYSSCKKMFELGLVQKTTRVTTRAYTIKQETTRHNTSTTQNNTRQNEYNMTQHKTTRVQHETTRVQNDTTRVQHSINFILILLHDRCLLRTWYIKPKLCWCLKLRKLKIAFPVKVKTELEIVKATVCCNCNFNCIFLPI